MSIEQDLLRYTDLTMPRLTILRDAASGKLTDVNAYTRITMKDLLADDCTLTEHGRQVLQRAEAILAGETPVTCEYHVKQAVSMIALRVRQQTRFRRMKADHIRLLIDVFTMPGICYRYLAHVHDYNLIEDLTGWGLIEGQPAAGAPFRITTAGKLLLEKEW